MVRGMEITPQIIRDRAYAARVSINKLAKRAGIATSTFYRWEGPKGTTPYPVTLGKLLDALEAFEAERKQ